MKTRLVGDEMFHADGRDEASRRLKMKTSQTVVVGWTTRGGFQAWVEVFFTPPRGDWLRRTQIHDVFFPQLQV